MTTPQTGMMYGITHALDSSPILRVAKILKVGIGLPKGPALNVWIAPDGKWKARIGYKSETAKTQTFASRSEAQAFYRDNIGKAPVANFPRKIGFFTFTRPTMVDGKELFEPDFEAIEAHGPTPTEIDIVFLDDQPFSGAYQMWSASELRCKGDGKTAQRLVTLATKEQKQEAEESIAAGEKYFTIVDQCWVDGCQYSKPTMANGKEQPSLCKPGGDLKFQLARNIRVGGTAYFHTTGIRSIQQLFSSLHQLRGLTGGRLAGIPLKMVLRPFKTNHNGQAATQYGVSLEFRAEDVEALKRNLIQQAMNFRTLAGVQAPPPQPRLIEAGTEATIEDGEEEAPIGAAAMAAEFYPEAVVEGETEPVTEPEPAAAASQAKTEGLAEKMRKARTKPEPAAPKPEPVAAPVTAEPADGDMF